MYSLLDSAVLVPTSSVKPTEPKNSLNIIFSSMKIKPKLFVGAAFFSTGKRPTSMYKKATPRSKPAPAQSKAAVAPTKTEAKRPKQEAVAPDQTLSPERPQQKVAEAVREG